MELIKAFVAVVVQFFDERGSGLPGDGLEEGGDIGEFGGFAVIDPFHGACLGKQVKEDEELFFREDAFFFPFCAFVEDVLVDDLGVAGPVVVELVVGAVVMVLDVGLVVVILDGDRVVRECRGIVEKSWRQDLSGSLIQGAVEMGLGRGEEFPEDIGSFIDKTAVDHCIFARRGETAKGEDGIQKGRSPADKVLYRIVGPILQNIGLGCGEVSWIFFIIFFKMLE